MGIDVNSMLEKVKIWIGETQMSVSMVTTRVITAYKDCLLRIDNLKSIEEQLKEKEKEMCETIPSLNNLSATENVLKKLAPLKQEVSNFIEIDTKLSKKWKIVDILQIELNVSNNFSKIKFTEKYVQYFF